MVLPKSPFKDSAEALRTRGPAGNDAPLTLLGRALVAGGLMFVTVTCSSNEQAAHAPRSLEAQQLGRGQPALR